MYSEKLLCEFLEDINPLSCFAHLFLITGNHEMNDPVKVIFAIAAVNDDEHLKLFQSVADYLIDD